MQAPLSIQEYFRKTFYKLKRLWFFSDPVKKVRITLRQPFLFVFWFILLVWTILQTNMFSVAGLSALSLLLLSAFFWNREMAGKISARRRLQYAAFQVGDELAEEISLSNESFLPVLWAEFMDQSSLPGYHLRGVRAANSYGKQKWTARTICKKRGLFQLGPWDLQLGDPFGIFFTKITWLEIQEILVYPQLLCLPAELLRHQRSFGDRSPLRQPLAEKNVLAFSTRSYQPGDPLRHIHWKTSARQADLFVKIFDPEAASRVWLLPDLEEKVHCGKEEESTLETTISICASLANYFLREKLSVGIFSGGENSIIMRPQAGLAYLWPLLRAISPLQSSPQASLEKTIKNSKGILHKNDLLVLITPSLDPQLVNLLAGQFSPSRIGCLLLDPAEYGGQEGIKLQKETLLQAGISASILRKKDLKPLPGFYGNKQAWEFMVLGTGRVIVTQAPQPFRSSPP